MIVDPRASSEAGSRFRGQRGGELPAGIAAPRTRSPPAVGPLRLCRQAPRHEIIAGRSALRYELRSVADRLRPGQRGDLSVADSPVLVPADSVVPVVSPDDLSSPFLILQRSTIDSR
jgi:hypothetical protein